MNSPFFSIVIPTYNRSDLVQGAVRSVLDQSFTDVEVVVSDNCSEDDTREVIGRMQDPRVRYVRTPAHWSIAGSWEFARRQARGEMIMMLSDDDAIVQGGLARFADEQRRYDADFMFCNLAEYRDSSFVGDQRNTVSCRPFTGRTQTVTKQEFLGPLFRFLPKFDMHPSAFLFSRRLADGIAERFGRFFATNGVEYFAWPLASALARQIVYVDAPFVVLGRTYKSWGATIVLSNPGKEQIAKMIADVEHKRDWVPLKNFTLINLMAEGLFLSKETMPDELASYPIDEQQYIRRTVAELRRRTAMGVDVARELDEALTYATKYPGLKAELMAEGADRTQEVSPVRKLARTLRLNLLYRKFDAMSEVRRVRNGGAKNGFTVSGDDLGFTDALGCAGFIAGLLDEPVVSVERATAVAAGSAAPPART